MHSKKNRHLLRNCSWKFRCNKTWNSLIAVKTYAFEKVRFCPDCKENVYLVESKESLFLAVEHNRCVAIPFDITNAKRMLDKPLVGSIAPAKLGRKNDH